LDLKIFNAIAPLLSFISGQKISLVALINEVENSQNYLLLKIIAILQSDDENINLLSRPYCFDFWLANSLHHTPTITLEEFYQRHELTAQQFESVREVLTPYIIYEQLTRAIVDFNNQHYAQSDLPFDINYMLDFLLNNYSDNDDINDNMTKALKDLIDHCLTTASVKTYSRDFLADVARKGYIPHMMRLLACELDLDGTHLDTYEKDSSKLLQEFLLFLDQVEAVCSPTLSIKGLLTLLTNAFFDNNNPRIAFIYLDNYPLEHGNTGLNLAIKSNNEEFIDCFLFEEATQLNLGDKDGNTALMCAINKLLNESVDCHRLIQELLNCGGDISNVEVATLRRLIEAYPVLTYDVASAIIAPRNLVLQDVQQNGNCFFSAIALYLNTEADEIRQQAIAYIEAQADEYQDFILGDINQFIQENSRSGEWANNIMIQAVANVYNIRITIYDLANGFTNIDPTNWDPQNPIAEASLFYTGNHYLFAAPVDNVSSDVSSDSSDDWEQYFDDPSAAPSAMPTFEDSPAYPSINPTGGGANFEDFSSS
jgi:hypothetical protein